MTSRLFFFILIAFFIGLAHFESERSMVQAKTFSPTVILAGIADFLNIINWGGFLPTSGDSLDFSSGSYVAQLGGIFSPTLSRINLIPGSTSNVILRLKDAITVSGSVTIGPGGTLEINAGSSLTGSTSLTVQAGGRIVMNGGNIQASGSLTVASQGNVLVSSSANFNGVISLQNGATMTISSNVAVTAKDINIAAGSTLYLQAGASLSLQNGASLNVAAGGSVVIDPGFGKTIGISGNINAASNITVTSGGLVLSSSSVNAQYVNMATGTSVSINGQVSMSGTKVTGGSITVAVSGTLTIAGIELATNVVVYGSLVVGPGNSTVKAGATVQVTGTTGGIAGTGNLNINAGGALAWDGAGPVTATGAINVEGEMTISGSAAKSISNAITVLSGGRVTYNVTAALSLSGSASIQVQPNGKFTSTSQLTVTGTASGAFILNAGIFEVSGAGTSTISTTIYNNGTMLVNGGAQLKVAGSFLQYSSTAELNVAGNAVLQIENGNLNLQSGMLKGSGTIVAGNVVAGKDVVIAPGSSPGKLTITGDLTLSETSVMVIECEGVSDVSKYDVVAASKVNLNGRVHFVQYGSYSWKWHDKFEFIKTTGGVSGSFNRISVDDSRFILTVANDGKTVAGMVFPGFNTASVCRQASVLAILFALFALLVI